MIVSGVESVRMFGARQGAGHAAGGRGGRHAVRVDGRRAQSVAQIRVTETIARGERFALVDVRRDARGRPRGRH